MWRMTSRAGRNMIEAFEGRRHKAYKCPAGKWTCGIGHVGPDVGPETVWSDEEIDERFSADLRKFEIGVNKLVLVPITQPSFDACVSIAYNTGLSALASSTLLRKLNAGDQAGAANEFLRWDKVAGKPVVGLTRRRRAEMAMFVSRD
jgi:lysozyme